MDNLIGKTLDGLYTVRELIGTGGMANVYKAVVGPGGPVPEGTVVAVKVLRQELMHDPDLVRRFKNESKAISLLNHPNIVKVYDVSVSDHLQYIVMEYVDGITLKEYLKQRGGALTWKETVHFATQVLSALQHAHSKGIIHRDVKPANIMVSTTGEVKITDFGVSYSTNQEQITQDGMVVGTAQYISPEQAQGKQATPQSDIYSLGVVAYEGLCGHRPFTGTTPVDIAAAHVNDPVPPLPDSIDVQLRQFVMSMLSKDPLDRPKDALTVSRTLSRIERRLLDQETAQMDETIMGLGGRMPRRVSSTPHTATLITMNRNQFGGHTATTDPKNREE